MAFVLSEEQQMLRDSARSFANEKLPISQLRKLREKGEGFDGTTWREMAELGFTGVLIPEEFGGSNFGYLGLGQVLEAQGRTIAASPLLSTALIGASALVIAGSQAQKETYLPQIASGDLITALAVDEGAHHDPSHIKLAAKKSAGGYTLSGDKRYVVDGVEAGLLIVAARTSGGESDTSGITLFLVQGDARGVSRTALKTLDAHAAANISFANVEVGADAVLGTVDAGFATLEQILDRARIGLAAEALGAADAAFEMTSEYLKVRKQFGQLIGSFQSLQHRAAVMFTELELTRSCVGAAFAALDANANNVAELASLAKARAAETLHLVSNETVQMHGGIGMTDVHDSGLYMKRARVLEALYGGESFHRDRYARLGGY
ncbi:MAG TPA: acyl-CoA dehydrogenase family protein [Hyphomonadaceae bacterium]|jgi:alkylation response protein AidB-like acyl-CoA dehydrogenase|nr:acyl-CoA dehydrogenase family protein [Hyphomonadaceae bacterium]